MKNIVQLKSFFALLILVITLSTSINNAQDFVVSGAGQLSANGTYILNGTNLGANKYTLFDAGVPTYDIKYDGVKWIIINVDESVAFYSKYPDLTGGEVLSPPTGQWDLEPRGHGPAPVVSNSALPVELVSFSAIIKDRVVALNWRTETEVNNYGFEVERAVNPKGDTKNWKTIGFVEGHGNSNSPKEYAFADENLSGVNRAYYRLKQIDNDGTYEYSPEVEVNFLSPDGYSLEQNYPNPFNPSTKIRYKIANGEFVKLSIYNVLGKEVVNLVNSYQQPGSYSVIFYADNLPGGVYFYKLETEHFVTTNKMLLLK
ncbi:hypothetical protein BMS3Abin03_02137 [bacterium BMS3Abin03]|nr:hypothetical protein BMS3Abin03_02137 [bacterium BMS3Abin03]